MSLVVHLCFIIARMINLSTATGSGGTVTFSGIPADTREPLPFLLRALDQFGDEIASITRNVRIGKNTIPSVYQSSELLP